MATGHGVRATICRNPNLIRREAGTSLALRYRRGALTRIEIEHRGWERLGGGGADWRDRNRDAWWTLLPHYIAEANAPAAGA
jgi:hypothetical protein